MIQRLISVELNGFKTFASPTKFEFSDRITAIVGPNGSGKSNVADAIRWVLGEQTYSLLRAKKTDDMIFSGSEIRPPSGMATATITFDNSDGWLPIDFSEVTITRRALRDGQNEYLINKQKVRLRDVNELLGRSGLSERTYTVIGQGLIDSALSLRADERRKLFEEAAGIGLYRSRKSQSLRRLDTTKRNLERVEDILAELKPRLNSLQRQAKRAEQYYIVRNDLREIMREWYGFHWHKAQRELKEVRAVAEKQDQNLKLVREEQEQFVTRLNFTREEVKNLRALLNQHRVELSNVQSERETTNRQLAVSLERERSLKERLDELILEKEKFIEESNLREDRVKVALAAKEQLEQEYQEALNVVSEKKKELDQRFEQRRTIEKEIETLQKEIDRLSNEQIEIRTRQEELEGAVKRNQQTQSELKKEIANLAEQMMEIEDRIMEAQEEKEATRSKIEANKAQIKQVDQDFAEEEQMQKGLRKKSRELETEIAKTKAELNVLEQADQSLTGFTSGAKLLLDAARKNQLTKTKGALSSHLDVPSKYETAITAVLGQYVDAVLIEGDSEIENALRLLENKPTQAVLLPTNVNSRKKKESSLTGQGIEGYADDLIKTSSEYDAVITLLLGSVLIVEDRKTALQLRNKANQANLDIVTLHGEIFRADGIISVNTSTNKGTISRVREKRELKDILTKLEKDFTDLDQQIDSLQERIEELDLHKEELEDVAKSLKNEMDEAGNKERRIILDQEQLQRQEKWQTKRLDEVEKEILKAVDTVKSGQQRLIEIDQLLADKQEVIRLKKQDLSGITINEIRSELNHWETRSAVNKETLGNAESKLNDAKLAHQELQMQIQENQQRNQATKQTIENLVIEMNTLKSSEGDTESHIQSLRDKITPAETRLQELEKELEIVQENETNARSKLNIAERHYNQAQMAFTRQQESLKLLRERIEDDFGLVSFDYDESIEGQTTLPLDGMIETLPVIQEISDDMEKLLKNLRSQLRRMGSINPEAQEEYDEVRDRFEFLTTQSEDLHKAETDIREVISELDELMQKEFTETFERVNGFFKEFFTKLFGGGAGHLILTNIEDVSNAGIDIETRLPGKRKQGLALLSGGERSLTAAALIFSLLKASPTPFCVMDEVDAMLDEANVGRFRDALLELAKDTQFVVITHNRNTVQAAEIIYGITMGRDSTSKSISLRLEEVDERYSSIE